MFITVRDLSTDIARWSGVVEEKKSKLLTPKLIENLLIFFACCIVLTLASLLISVELLKNLIVGFVWTKKGRLFFVGKLHAPNGFCIYDVTFQLIRMREEVYFEMELMGRKKIKICHWRNIFWARKTETKLLQIYNSIDDLVFFMLAFES